ncbi:MAG: aliphatic sulfonate transporter [Rhodospirillales bacterium]|nr:aliphatic sulfonate transporter [Rhodospirillales bacterium]
MRKERAIRIPPVVSGLIGLALLIVAVEVLAKAGVLPKLSVPPPSAIADAVWRLIAHEGLLTALVATLLTTLCAVGAAIAVGLPAGYFLYRHRSFRLAYRNWLAALFAAPTVLLYPLVLVFFGRTYTAIGVMAFVTGIVPIVLGTCDGLAAVPRVLLNVGRVFHTSRVQEFWKILLPAGALTIFTGIRLGTIYALLNVIGIEFLVNFGGLGYVVSSMYDRFDFPGMYAAILFVIVICVSILHVLSAVERRLRPA